MFISVVSLVLAALVTAAFWWYGFGWLPFVEGYLISLPLFLSIWWYSSKSPRRSLYSPYFEIFDVLQFLVIGGYIGLTILERGAWENWTILLLGAAASEAFGLLYLWLMKRRDRRRASLA